MIEQEDAKLTEETEEEAEDMDCQEKEVEPMDLQDETEQLTQVLSCMEALSLGKEANKTKFENIMV